MSTQQNKINAFDSEKYKWGKNGPQKYSITVGAMNAITKSLGESTVAINSADDRIDQLASDQSNLASKEELKSVESKLDQKVDQTTYNQDLKSVNDIVSGISSNVESLDQKVTSLSNDHKSFVTQAELEKYSTTEQSNNLYAPLSIKDDFEQLKNNVATKTEVSESLAAAKQEIQTNVDSKVDTSNFDSLSGRVSATETMLQAKANSSDLSDAKETLELVQSELDDKATITELNNQIRALRELVASLTLINRDSVNINQPDNAVNVTSNFDGTKASNQSKPTFAITGKTVTMSSNTANDCILAVNGSEGVSLQGVSTNGVDYSKVKANDPVQITSTETVVIDGLTWTGRSSGYGYNAVSIGFNNSIDIEKMKLPKKIVIRNLDLTAGEFKNNPIGIYGFAEGAEILIENCKFGLCSNPIRISNIGDKSATITIKNCSINQCYYEDGSENYRGFMLLQDYSESGYKDFASKLTINFENCSAGKDYTLNDSFNHFGLTKAYVSNGSELMTGDKNAFLDKHWIYVYRNNANTGDGAQAGIITDLDQWPIITAK